LFINSYIYNLFLYFQDKDEWYIDRGYFYIREGDSQSAYEMAEKIENQRDYRMHEIKIYSLLLDDEFGAVETEAEKLNAYNTQEANISYNLLIGSMKFQQKRYDESYDYFHEILKINNNDYEANVAIGNLYLGIGRVDEALIHFNRAKSVEMYFKHNVWEEIPRAYLRAGLYFAYQKKGFFEQEAEIEQEARENRDVFSRVQSMVTD